MAIGQERSNTMVEATADTKQQKSALAKAFAEGSEKATGKTIACPECGVPNAVSRMTCEVCHAKLRVVGKQQDELRKKLFESNKRLKAALQTGDKALANKLKAAIAKDIGQSKGAYKVGPDGMAVEAKPVKKASPVKKEPKVLHNCPCCGQQVGGFFAMGHDGRVHGMLLKIGLGKLKKTEVPAAVQKMYEIWSKNKSLSMKEVAKQLK